MTSHDEFDDLKRAMADATPAPDAARKADILARAQANFEATQETLARARQTSDRPENRGVFRGVFDMIRSHSIGALTGTTALIAVGFLVLSPAGQDMLRGGPAEAPQFPEAGQLLDLQATPPDPDPTLTAEPDPAPQPPAHPSTEELAADTPAPELQETPAPTAILIPQSPPIIALDGEFADADVAPSGQSPAHPVTQFGAGNSAAVAPRAPAPSGGLAISGSAEMGIAAPAESDGVAIGLIASPEGRIQQGTPDTIAPPQPDTEEFANEDDNPLRVVAEDPVSTFSIDVDTASYSLLRSSLNRGQLPNPDAIRIEEMVNYFPYDLPAPDAGDLSPFRPTIEVFETPWNPDTQLVHIGIQGELPAIEDRPPLNLVFLIDTSGSMNDPTKLPLLIQSFRLMLDRLQPEDEVAIVTYAGNAGVALQPTPASDTATISAALTALQAGGSTNGVGGLQAAYDLAAEMTDDGEVSRVLLATDGDFNVGISDPDALEDYIAEQRETGIYLSVLGFGRGNLQDDTMQALAQNGNGTAAYIDTLHEAQRVLVDQLAGALFPIADDLKVQVEFNPEVIAEYRLIGYETRALAREDFANDAVDAGELGAGHSVVAIYEVTPVGSPAVRVAPLRYAADDGAPEEGAAAEFADELGFISLRWKEPGDDESTLVEIAIPAAPTAPGTEAQFAAAIAGFGQLLRGNEFLGDWSYAQAIALANANRGTDEFGYRQEAVQLMRLAQSRSGE